MHIIIGAIHLQLDHASIYVVMHVLLLFPLDLIREYELERQNIDNLREMAYVLKEEIHNLTSTFIQEAQTLNECYKTP